MDWKKWISFNNDHNEDKEEEQFNNNQKDIEAKVTFYYPKKQYQISYEKRPLKSRGNVDLTRSKSIEAPINDAQETYKLLNKSRQRRQLRTSEVHSNPNEISQTYTRPLKDKKPKETVKKGPFRPTEIPSPIYGLQNKGKEKQEAIEFELSGLETSPVTNLSPELEDTQREELQQKIEFINNNLEKLPSTDTYSSFQENEEEKVHDASQDIGMDLEVVTTVSLEDERAIIDSVEANVELGEMGAGLSFSIESLEQPLVEKNEKELNENTKNIQLGDSSREQELDQFVGEIGVQELEQFVEEIDEQELEQLVEEIDEQELEQLVEEIEEKEQDQLVGEIKDQELDSFVGEFGEQDQNKFVESTREEEQLQPSESSSPQEHSQQPKRKTVPFNVLMLKSDREALKRRSQGTAHHSGSENESQKPNKEPLVKPLESSLDEQMNYHFPSRTMLKEPLHQTSNQEWLEAQSTILDRTLKSFNVGATVVGVSEGPTVTRFEISPDLGVKVNKITNLTDDLKLSLAAKDIRIEAPIPGKHTIGIEVPNKSVRPVYLREIIDQETFTTADSPLTVALGLDITGKPILTDLKKMPHGLIAGATGSGKSVCINTFLVSLLFKARPDEVKLLLIDPKMVELAPYNEIPHLLSPVITDVKAATAALKWAVEEMERRYELFAATGVRDIAKFNEKDALATGEHQLPYIVIIIDELADLMMMSPADVEESIARIAQKARACGIHLIIATQRPSVDVITGLIKANVPTRIAFSVSSQIDSRTIIDISGAERLLGKGDMLFLDNGTSKAVRLQGPFISDEEIEMVVDHVRSQGSPEYLFQQEELIKKANFEENDELLLDACEFAVNQGNISTSSLQRHFRIGYNRAARIIEMMEEKGLITESKGSKPRDVLITEEELKQFTDSQI